MKSTISLMITSPKVINHKVKAIGILLRLFLSIFILSRLIPFVAWCLGKTNFKISSGHSNTKKFKFIYCSVKKPKLDLVSDAEKKYLELIETLPSVCEISRRIHEPKFIDLESVIHYWKVLKVVCM